jgi:AcrR family transcriptional regulator
MPRAIAARAPLSRDVVLTAAVALADERGLEGVSMRHLADALGVVPMALYKHVGDKEDLLDGMVEHLLTGLGVGGTTGHQADRTADHTSKPLPWREAVTGPIHGVRALHRKPASCAPRPSWHTWND